MPHITTIFIDESDLSIGGLKHQIIGGLFSSEGSSLHNGLLETRIKTKCSTTLHGVARLDRNESSLFDNWIKEFYKDPHSNIQFLLYPYNNIYKERAEYFAQQTLFFIKHLMKAAKPTTLLRIIHHRKYPETTKADSTLSRDLENMYQKRILPETRKLYGCNCVFGFSEDEVLDELQFIDVNNNLINKFLTSTGRAEDRERLAALIRCELKASSFDVNTKTPLSEMKKLEWCKKVGFFYTDKAAAQLRDSSKPTASTPRKMVRVRYITGQGHWREV